jgi:hypothetical protein
VEFHNKSVMLLIGEAGAAVFRVNMARRENVAGAPVKLLLRPMAEITSIAVMFKLNVSSASVA